MIKELLLKLSGFSIVGVFVTFFSFFLVFIFIGILKTPLYLSYILIYLITIFISYLLNKKYVFKVKGSKKKVVYYYLIYLTGMIIGVISLGIFKMIIPYKNWILACFVIPITFSWNFVMVLNILRI